MGVSIKNVTRRLLRGRRVFSDIAASVLPGWDISLVFVGPKQAQALNEKLRGKSYIPNVLSYRLGAAVPDEAFAKSGEIIICPSEAAKQAPDFCLLPSAYCLLLFIHGLLHIKGLLHGAKMSACEQTLLKRYAPTHSNRNRHRHVPDQSGRRRGAH